ncbi:MAG: hypothetical protein R3264_15900, partial [Anaerolineae bacterium]|nr:hypothetical protein [Anaerolineae bacterium]
LYTVPGGGAVFSANSPTFSNALQVDTQAAQLMRNVLDRFIANNVPPEPTSSSDTDHLFYDRFNCNNMYSAGVAPSYSGPAWDQGVPYHNYLDESDMVDANVRYTAACGVDGAGLEVTVDRQETFNLITELKPNWQGTDVLSTKMLAGFTDLIMTNGEKFTLLDLVVDDRHTGPDSQAQLQVRKRNGNIQLRVFDTPTAQKTTWVTVPTSQPVLVETMVDQPNNLLSLRVDGVRYDVTVNLASREQINRVDLTLQGLDSGTQGKLCLDELIYDDTRLGSGSNPTPTPTPVNTPTATPTPSDTPTPTATTTPPTPTPTPTDTPEPPSSLFYFSPRSSGAIGAVTGANNKDVLRFDGADYAMFFDASDVGLGTNLAALHLLDANTMLFAVRATTSIPGLGSVDPRDIVQFTATSFGDTTAGSFSLYFDGSDVGLDTSSDDIDGFTILPDNSLLISTVGGVAVPGLSAADEDILRFIPTSLGDTTSGAWELYFDGSDVDLSTSDEDIDGLALAENGDLYFTTLGNFAVTGLSGQDEDLFSCTLTAPGSSTACQFATSLYFDGSSFGLDSHDIDAVAFAAQGGTPLPTPTPTDTPTPTNTPSGPTPTPTNTPTPGAETFYFSLQNGGVYDVGPVAAVRNEDILSYDGSSFARVFDGSDVGVTGNLGAFHFVDADTLLFSVRSATTIAGVGAVDDFDIIQFEATSLGDDTTGSFSRYFDGEDVGLSTSSEDIDAIAVTTDNRLLISTAGSAAVPGVSNGRDEDILAFTPTSL